MASVYSLLARSIAGAGDMMKLKSAASCCLAAFVLLYLSVNTIDIAIMFGAVFACLVQAYLLRYPEMLRRAPFKPSSTKSATEQGVSREPRLVCTRPGSGPLPAAKFRSTGWEAGVNELLENICVTPEGLRAAEDLAMRSREAIEQAFPRSKIRVTCKGNPLCSESFAIPEAQVQIVVTMSTSVPMDPRTGLPNQVAERRARERMCIACRERLVSFAGFRPVRNAFRGEHPKVTLLGTVSTSHGDRSVPMDLYVNTLEPLRYEAVVAEFQNYDRVVPYLVLLVQRWAHDRVMSHVAKGHLKGYAWALFVIYFLQVREPDDLCASLPSRRGNRQHQTLDVKLCQPPDVEISTRAARLFKEFVNFYTGFDWRAEGISVRQGKRLAPDVSLPMHVVVFADGDVHVSPCIEDPFDCGQNLGAVLTASGLLRLQRELARAASMCRKGCSLREILDPEAPTQEVWSLQNSKFDEEQEAGDDEEDQCEGNDG